MSEDPVEAIARVLREHWLLLPVYQPWPTIDFDLSTARALIDAGRAVPEGMTADALREIAASYNRLVDALAGSEYGKTVGASRLRAWAAVLDRSVQDKK